MLCLDGDRSAKVSKPCTPDPRRGHPGRLLGWVFAISLLVLSSSTGAETLRVLGSVGDVSGQPLAGAVVLLEPLSHDYESKLRQLEGEPFPHIARVTTASNGFFELVAPQVGVYRVRVEAPGHGVRVCDLVALTGDVMLPPVELPVAEATPFELRDLGGEEAEKGWFELEPTPAERGEPAWGASETVEWRAMGPRGRVADSVLLEPGFDSWVALVLVPDRPPHRQLWSRGEPLQGASVRGLQVEVFEPSGEPMAGGLIELQEGLFASSAFKARPTARPLAMTDAGGRALLDIPDRCLARGRRGDERFKIYCALVAWSPIGGRYVQMLTPPATGTDETWQVSLRPRPTGWWQGKVVNATDGSPVAKALVWSRNLEDPRTVRGDDRGRYRWPFEEDSHSLAASAPGYGLGALVVRWDPSEGPEPKPVFDRSENRLPPLPHATVEGWVVDSGGAPVAGVDLLASPSYDPADDARWERVGRSDSEGRVVWTRAPTGTYLTTRPALAGHRGETLRISPLDGGERRDRLRWRLKPLLRGVGRVVDLGDRPVAGATVDWIDAALEAELERGSSTRSRSAVLGRAVTDQDGRFEVVDLFAGSFDLEARASGFAPLRVRGVEIPELDGELDLGTLVLAPGSTLEGRVVEPDGDAVPGARLWISEQAPGRSSWVPDRDPDAIADADGRFALGERPADETLWLIVGADHHVTRVRGAITLPSEPIEVVLEPASTVRGVVLGPDRSPVTAGQVRLRPERTPSPVADDGLRFPRMVGLDQDGGFELQGVPAGRMTLEVTSTGFLDARVEGIEVPEAGQVEGLEILLEEGASLRGSVTDVSGAPLRGLTVQIETRQGTWTTSTSVFTDAEGRYRHQGLETGPVRVVFRTRTGHSESRHFEIEPGDNVLDWRLEEEPGVEVSGRTLAADGSVWGGAWVHLEALTPPPTGNRSHNTRSRDDGSFALRNVPPGEYRLWATPGVAGWAGDRKVTIGDSDVRDLAVRVSEGKTITGRVLGLAGDEMARVSIRALYSSDEVRPDYSGTYRLEGLPAVPDGIVVVATLGAGERTARGRALFDGDDPVAVVDLDFAAGSTLRGRLTAGGRPVEGLRIGCLEPGSRSQCGIATSDAEGLFEFANLEEGAYSLFVVDAGDSLVHQEVVQFDVEPAPLEVGLGWGELAGRVVRPDGTPADGARVVLVLEGGDALAQRRQTADGEGRFRFPWVAAGAWKLQATEIGFAPASKRLQLADGEQRGHLDLTLAAEAGVTLRVEHRGTPVEASFDAAFLDAAGNPVARVRAQSDGTGRLPFVGVPTGRWQMVLTGQRWTQVQQWVETGGTEISGSEIAGPETVVQLEPGGFLRVTRPAALGERHSGVFFELEGPDGRPHYWLVEPVRRRLPFVGPEQYASGLVPGVWTVRILTDDGEAWTTTAEVEAGEAATAQFE